MNFRLEFGSPRPLILGDFFVQLMEAEHQLPEYWRKLLPNVEVIATDLTWKECEVAFNNDESKDRIFFPRLGAEDLIATLRGLGPGAMLLHYWAKILLKKYPVIMDLVVGLAEKAPPHLEVYIRTGSTRFSDPDPELAFTTMFPIYILDPSSLPRDMIRLFFLIDGEVAKLEVVM